VVHLIHLLLRFNQDLHRDRKLQQGLSSIIVILVEDLHKYVVRFHIVAQDLKYLAAVAHLKHHHLRHSRFLYQGKS